MMEIGDQIPRSRNVSSLLEDPLGSNTALLFLLEWLF
jgi:hypothetical protein